MKFQVQLAEQIYELVDRHLRKLDQELSKFKMELEADNGGITEILEQRSLELDNPPPHSSHSVQFYFYASKLDKAQSLFKSQLFFRAEKVPTTIPVMPLRRNLLIQALSQHRMV